MKMNERRVPRVSRMVSEWFREVPDDPGSVRNGPGSVRNGFGHIWKVRKDRKVMEGSGRVRDDPDYREKSGWFHNWCSHVSLKGKASFPKRQGRFCEFNSDSEKEAVFG
jgi:hypothetical protein